MKTPRIAFCSPVNPAPSGISDYSEELLPYLAQYADITLYLDEGLKPASSLLARHLELRPLRRLARDERRRPYDGILYHMGNSPVHAGIWSAAQRTPGVVVLHEFVLHHFMLWYVANVLHDVQLYVRAMGRRYGEQGTHIAQLMIRSRFSESAFDFPCCEPVVGAARGLIAHSRYVLERVAALRPDLPCALVPMGVPLPTALSRAAARAALGLPADALILASFGHINAYKRLEPVLRALAELRRSYPEVRYLLVGSVSPNFDPAGLVARMGLTDVVQITGFVARDDFERYVAAADICLNLRHPTAGETSASLLRLLGAGRATLVSATGSFAELPPGVAAQVDLDASEADQILAYCRLLAARPDLAAALGARARTYVAEQHSLDLAAQGYARFLARLYGWPALRRVRASPLWQQDDTLPTQQSATVPGQQGDMATGATRAQVLSDPALGRVAQALVELGVTEHDEVLLKFVAERLAEL